MNHLAEDNHDIACSIIIPNLHSTFIDQTLQSIFNQKTDHSFEVIVVGMDKWGLVEQFPEVQFIQTPQPVGAAEARNIGIRAARADRLLFIDADCVALPGWIDRFFEAFDEGWQVIGGGVKTPTEDFWVLVYNLSMFHEFLWTTEKREHPYLPTLNLALSREVIEQVGLLNETLLRGQDMEWTARMTRAGYPLLFLPQATIEHFPTRNDLKTLKKFFFRSGYYMINVRHQYPEIFKMRKIMRHAFLWRYFSPGIAAWTTFKILLRSKEIRKHWQITPYIYLLKMAWCAGAAEGLQAAPEGESHAG